MGREPSYTSADALIDLGGKPDETEIKRLKEYYPTYQLVHRTQLLLDMFNGSSQEEFIFNKLMAKSLDTSVIKQAKGGHGRWVRAKVRKTVIRLLYLRYRINQGMSRVQANQQLVKRFPFSDKPDAGQSSIRKATRSVLLDGCYEL